MYKRHLERTVPDDFAVVESPAISGLAPVNLRGFSLEERAAAIGRKVSAIKETATRMYEDVHFAEP